jgi:uncharacterized membrane protein (DUF373 family)
MEYILKKIEHLQRWILVGLSILSTTLLLVLSVQLLISFVQYIIKIDINNISADAIFTLLGSFLTALIILELIENISVYLKDHMLNVEVAVTTALIAISRKIILFELDKESYQKLIALGFAVISLSVAYYLMHKSHIEKSKILFGTDNISKAMRKRRASDI